MLVTGKSSAAGSNDKAPGSRYRRADRSPAGVVIGGGMVLFVGFGTAYAMPALFPEVGRALGIPAQHLSALFSATGALYFLLGMLSGPIADRINPRSVVAVGLLVLAVGLVMTSLARSELAFEAGVFLSLGIGIGLTYVPVVGAVQASCRNNPAVAGGIAASGIGAGTLVVPPLADLMVGWVGWREALLGLALLATVGTLAALPIAGRQEAAARDSGRTSRAISPLAGPDAFRFALLYLAQLAISVVAFVPFCHLVPFAQASGWRGAAGVCLISLIGAGGIGGRVLLGFVARRFGSCRTAGLCALIMAVSLAGFTVLTGGWELGAIAVLYGLGYGGSTGLLGPITGEVLGARGICQSVGWIATSRAFGVLIGPSAVGLLAFRSGGYTVPFLLCACIAIAAMFLFHRLHGLTGRGDSQAMHSTSAAAVPQTFGLLAEDRA